MSKVDMGLDDIIAASKTGRGGRGAGRGGGRGTRSRGGPRGGGGPPRGGRGANSSNNFGGRGGSFNRGNVEGQWSQNAYNAPKMMPALATAGSGKLLISNLDLGVTESDVHELFGEFGQLKSSIVHYDRSGRSLGTAEVVYDRKSDAIKAMKQYNGVPLDGRPMKIEITGTEQDLAAKQRFDGDRGVRGGGVGDRGVRRGGVGDTRARPARGGGGAARGGRGGRGGGRGGKEPAPSVEDLDKEMDAYMRSRS